MALFSTRFVFPPKARTEPGARRVGKAFLGGTAHAPRFSKKGDPSPPFAALDDADDADDEDDQEEEEEEEEGGGLSAPHTRHSLGPALRDPQHIRHVRWQAGPRAEPRPELPRGMVSQGNLWQPGASHVWCCQTSGALSGSIERMNRDRGNASKT